VGSGSSGEAPAYAELHCRSNFSFLSGASHPRELVQQAAEIGLAALAITDLSGLYGVVRAWEAARQLPAVPRLIYGSELELDRRRVAGDLRAEDALVLLARSREGYAELSGLISKGRLRVEKGEFALDQAEVRRVGGRNLIVLAGGPRSRLLRLLRAGELATDDEQRTLIDAVGAPRAD